MRHFPDPRQQEQARLSPRDIVRANLCIGCGCCAAGSADASMRWDRHGQLKPHGPRQWLHGRTQEFAKQCPFSPTAIDEDRIAAQRFAAAAHRDPRLGSFIAAYVGHVAEAGFRDNGSSGGLTSWVGAELLRTGQVDAVAHVAPVEEPQREGRHFAYRLSRSLDELCRGAKSRYYPVELSGILRKIRTEPGRYAVVGIPCFIKAIHLLRRCDPLIAERVTHTLGLFCGHMKSARLAESFAWQLGADIAQVKALDYRLKDASRPANWYRAQLQLADGRAVAQDWWHLADGDWGAGFFQNAACNACDDVVAETADISFGDAWVEPFASDGRGTNVVIVRTPELHLMIETAIADSRLELSPVNADFVAETQAAGLRHRREGLAYRLSWARSGMRPRKRVAASRTRLNLRRKLVYRARAAISAWSHRIFALARLLHAPRLYVIWARIALAAYQGLTYSRGRFGRFCDFLLGPQARS